MTPSEAQLERLIAEAVRGAGRRTAPASLEARVLNAIERRSSLPWWRRDFARWPAVARLAFVIGAAGLAYLALGAPLWLWESSRAALPAEISWMQVLAETVRVIIDHLPSVFVYSALAALVLLYGTLFGVGAIAYRTLFGGSGNSHGH